MCVVVQSRKACSGHKVGVFSPAGVLFTVIKINDPINLLIALCRRLVPGCAHFFHFRIRLHFFCFSCFSKTFSVSYSRLICEQRDTFYFHADKKHDFQIVLIMKVL